MIVAELWPALIPLVLYLMWQLRRRRHARRQGHDIPRFLDGPWVWTLIASLSFAILGFLLLGLSNPHNSGTHYQPKQFIDGVLQEEQFDR